MGNGLSPLISYVVIHVLHYMVHAFTYKKIPVNIPPIIAHTPVKKCMKDLKKVKNNYKTLIVSRFFVT